MITGGWGIPGVGSEVTVTESELLWGADHARNAALWQGVVFSGTMRDDANSPTTVLRPGLLVGKLDATGEYEEWDADVATGTQNFAGVLDTELHAQDWQATNTDRLYRLLVARAPIKARKLLIQGAAFLGHADEYLARRQMVAAGFVFDDDPQGYKAGGGYRMETVAGTTDTLTASQNGMILFYSNVASVTVTLPAIQPGLVYDLMRVGDEEFVITSAEGDNMGFGNDLSGDSVTWTTAGEHLGAHMRVRSFYVGTTLKWICELVPSPFGTGAALQTHGLAT